MSHARHDYEISSHIDEEPELRPSRWVIRLVVALGLVVLAILAWRALIDTAPRWYSHRIGARIDGHRLRGLAWGLGIGGVFAFVPVLVLLATRRRFVSWTWKLILTGLAVALAVPNIVTLYIVLSSSAAAHQAQRTLDVDAPWFRAGSLIGAIAGGLLALTMAATATLLRHRKKQVRRLRAQLDEHRHRQLKGDSDDAEST